MLDFLIERGSWLVMKVGMPLVFFYHVIVGSVFFNTAAEDASGLEKAANVALIPMQYLFEGSVAIADDDGYHLERRFDYEHHFFVKTAASVTALPFSILIGGTLKSIAYISPQTRKRAEKIYVASHSSRISSFNDYYRSIGMEIEDFDEAEFIAPPQYRRHPEAKHRLESDLGALKEIIRILEKEKIPFWIDCGSCLGTYQYGGCIPHDWDIDIGVLLPDFHNVKNALQKLDPDKYVVQNWSGRALPESYLKVFVKESGGMIDIYHFAIDPEKKEISTLLSNEFNIFLPRSWVVREKRYSASMAVSDVFPLTKALFEGIEVPVPGNIEKYLQVFYGENLAPAKIYNEITGTYEKDLTHPYWDIPHVH